ncbi:MAG: hypothetical protein AAGU76_00720 [Sedimentibacter sp.]|uniref:hypothetical protein n=1 Tax=Sedimentibacter sp. TaxID=1960295 RepID=UPI003159284D
MTKDKNLKKAFVKEAIGDRNYMSYRIDLALYKVMLSIAVLLVFYIMTGDFFISALFAAQVFAVFTLINKLNVDRKTDQGKEKLILRKKKEHFRKRLDEINTEDFEILIGFLFGKEGWRNYVKKGRHMYLAEKDGIIHCIMIFRTYADIDVERLDVRNMIEYMGQNSIKTGHMVYTGSLSDGATEMLEKFKDRLEINRIGVDELYEIMSRYQMLPEDESFIHRLTEEKNVIKSREEIKNNIFGNKKTVIYILAAIFFYGSSRIMSGSFVSRYIFYYFSLLSVVGLLYTIAGINLKKKAK